MWQRYFGRDPGIVGRSVSLDGRAYTVTGVMPASFEFPDKATLFWTLSYWGIPIVAALDPGTIPRLKETRLDAPVFLFSIVVSLVTGVCFGLAPALRLARPDARRPSAARVSAACPPPARSRSRWCCSWAPVCSSRASSRCRTFRAASIPNTR
jgi:hypothetical protein